MQTATQDYDAPVPHLDLRQVRVELDACARDAQADLEAIVPGGGATPTLAYVRMEDGRAFSVIRTSVSWRVQQSPEKTTTRYQLIFFDDENLSPCRLGRRATWDADIRMWK